MRINTTRLLSATLLTCLLSSNSVSAASLTDITCADVATWIDILPPKPTPIKALDEELKQIFSDEKTAALFGTAYSEWNYQNLSDVRNLASDCRQSALKVDNKGFADKLSKVVLYIITQPLFRAGPTK